MTTIASQSCKILCTGKGYQPSSHMMVMASIDAGGILVASVKSGLLTITKEMVGTWKLVVDPSLPPVISAVGTVIAPDKVSFNQSIELVDGRTIRINNRKNSAPADVGCSIMMYLAEHPE